VSSIAAAESRLESALALLSAQGDPYRAIALARPLLVLAQIDLGAMREARDAYRDDVRMVSMPTPLTFEASRQVPRIARHHITLGEPHIAAPLVLAGMLCDSEGGEL
jgi:hypothetical protein